MTKYHISRDGTPSVCRANTGSCPLGGADKHFISIEDAQTFADMKHSSDFIDDSTNPDGSNNRARYPMKRTNQHKFANKAKLRIKRVGKRAVRKLTRKTMLLANRSLRKGVHFIVHAPKTATVKTAQILKDMGY